MVCVIKGGKTVLPIKAKEAISIRYMIMTDKTLEIFNFSNISITGLKADMRIKETKTRNIISLICNTNHKIIKNNAVKIIVLWEISTFCGI